LKALTIKGTVFSGKGKGAKYIKLTWVRRQIREKLGLDPYSGTLNIRLASDQSERLQDMLGKMIGIEILPEEGFRRARCFNALLMGRIECAVVLPEVADYPRDVMELVAPANLKEKLGLKDGDVIEVTIVL
jgi:CTP-dependent riboflavin kinase